MTAERAEAGLAAVLELLRERAALVFPEGRLGEVKGAVRRALGTAGASDYGTYLRMLREDSERLDMLIAECTVGETYFFREPVQLDFIRRRVLPEIEGRRPTGEIRVWSAGCASGEEPYSLAILLGEAGLGDRSNIVGTDVARGRLERAREGRYGAWSLRGVTEALVRRYFIEEGKTHRLASEVRSAARFRHLNLAEDSFPSVRSGVWNMDLVLCRNVLIYLDPATVPEVAGRLYDSLAPGGWLFLAASDPPLSSLAPFETIVADHGIAYRRPLKQADRSPWRGGRPSPPFQRSLAPASPADKPQKGTPVQPMGGAVKMDGTAAPRARSELPSTGVAAEGEEGGSVELTDGGEAVARVRELADRGRLAEAGRECAAALERYGPSADLLYLHSMLLVEGGHYPEAAAAARRALYLHGEMAVAHVGLGTALARMGNAEGARRAFRNASALLSRLPPDEAVPGSGDETAYRLLEMTRAQLRLLEEAVS